MKKKGHKKHIEAPPADPIPAPPKSAISGML